MGKREKAVERVKKLMALLEDAQKVGHQTVSVEVHAAEIQALAARIAALKREYLIEDGELESQKDEDDFSDYGMTLVKAYTVGGEVPWQAFLFNIIAESHQSQCVILRETGDFFIAGSRLDRAITLALSAHLVASVDGLAREKYQDAKFADPAVYLGQVSQHEYFTSFRSGFMQALESRLREEEEGSGATALVLISKAVQKTQRYLAKRVDGPAQNMTVEVEIRHGGASQEGWNAWRRISAPTG